MILTLLPLAAFVTMSLYLATREPEWGWGKILVRAVLGLGVLSVLIAELLSLFGGLRRLPLALVWFVTVTVIVWLVWRERRGDDQLRLPEILRLEPWQGPFLLAIGSVALVTFVVALLAPPNTWDSLTYHVARVAHWAQNGSLAHYPTGIERQNYMGPGASVAMLHSYVLAGSDIFVSHVPWLATLAAGVAVAESARLLGGSKGAQLFAAAFLLTLPTGIVQASSTLTDYFTALWVLILVAEVLRYRQERSRGSLVYIALAVALAINSKPVAAPYLLVVGGYAAAVALTRSGWRGPAVLGGLTLAAVLFVNAGYFGRNMATYGNPLGRNSKVENHSNTEISARVLASNTLRNASLHAGTSWDAWNRFAYRGLASIHAKLGLTLNEPGTSIHPEFEVYPPRTDEVRSGSFWHAAVILLTALAAVVRWRHTRAPVKELAAVGVLAFMAFSLTFQFTIFGSRYHLPFFMIMTPVVAAIWGRCVPRWTLAVTVIFLLVTSWPWLVHVENRPLIPSERAQYSIVSEARRDLYLPHSYQRALEPMAGRVQASRCNRLGLMISGNSPEYAIWAYLGAPTSQMQIRWVVAGTPSARYDRADFDPCAIICENCPEAFTANTTMSRDFSEHTYHLYLHE